VLTGRDISSLVVDRLCDQARGQNTAVACFYFDFAARKEQSATNVLGSLLKQIVSGMGIIPEEISRAFQEHKNAIGGRGLQVRDIVKMLQAITCSLRTVVCIDALDECAAVHRVKLLNSLKQILDKSPGTRVFITGRPHIRAEIEKRLHKRVTSLSIGSSKDDIIGYLRVRLDEDETPDAMDESLEVDILEQIPETMSEMCVRAMILGTPLPPSANRYASRFLLVSLNIDAILRESTIYRRQERLRNMTGGLGLEDIYGATMERIRAQDGDKSRLGMAALMWISHAERPLQSDELCHALAVELGSTDFNASNVPSTLTLVGCCQGLITVDKEASTVRLIHFTLQEYLSGHPDIFSRPHSRMAEICLTYLNSRQIRDLSAAPSPDTHSTPFLEYCSVYWGIHAKKELSDCTRSLALELLRGHYCRISTKLLLGQVKNLYLGHLDICSPFSGLHCASFFGLIEVVTALIEMQCYDINEGDFSGCTPLAWAARNGHQEVVGVLLRRGGVNPEKGYNDGRTPLSYAAWNGHERVVEALLGSGEVNADKPDIYGQTPLSYAAWGGGEGVVKILLGREEVNPDKLDNYGQTPLSYAAWRGYEGVVKILLGRREVKPDRPDMDGRTPLLYAARYGNEGVVKILLERGDVSPDRPDNYGQTPLSWAAWPGREEVVEMLLRREDVSPDKPDARGRTPLWYAAVGGRGSVVELLLGREDVNPNRPDNSGQTALSLATKNGHEKVVALLQPRKVIAPGTI